jgi:hypothetical protein
MNKKLSINNNNNSLLLQLRTIRDKISLEIKDLNNAQMKNYFKRKKSLFSEAKWEKSLK